MKKADNNQAGVSLLSDELLCPFVEVFYRIFKIGIYYPVGHVVIDQSAENFVKKLRETFPDHRTISLEFNVDGLFIEKVQLPEKNISVRELYQLMTRLGVQSIEFDRIISYKHFLRFVKSLLSWRAELDGSKSLRSFNIADLPSTIRVTQEKYVVDGSSLDPEDPESDFSQNLEKMYDALAEQGLTSTQVDGCRELMVKLSTLTLGEKVDIDGFPHATWHDVQSLLIQSIARTSAANGARNSAVLHADINTLSSIFVNLEKGLTDQKSKDAIRILIAHLANNSEEGSAVAEPETSLKKDNITVTENSSFEVTADEIKRFVQEKGIPFKVLGKMSFADRSQELTIVLQLLHTSRKREVLKRCRRIIKTILLSQVSAKEWEIVFSWLRYIAESGDVKQFRSFLLFVIQTLRDCQEVNSKIFIVNLWKKMPARMHVLLWPFVVNELLYLGMEKDLEVFYQLTKVACSLPVSVTKQLWHQLEEMSVLEEKKVAAVFFRPAFIYSYQLFSFLLETSLGEIICPAVLASLKQEPQDAFFKVVGPVLEASNPVHRDFLCVYLSQVPFKEVPLILQMGAGKIILEFLGNISDTQREEEWLPETLESTAILHTKGMKEMLERVVEERKMKVIYVWPKSCRRAAESALKILKRQKLSRLL